jgi:hypothetical protein
MAIVYPSVSGNWSDVSLWMEVGGNPYGQIPQDGDVVYLNGCTITADMNINLGSDGQIRNDGDDGQGITEGGDINTTSASRSIISDFLIYHSILRTSNNTGRVGISITGNIEFYSSSFNGSDNININYTIVGNISAYGSFSKALFTDRGSSGSTLTITGDIYVENSATLVTGNYTSNTITGDIGDVQINSGSPTTVTLNGNCNPPSINLIGGSVTTFNMNGTLTQGQGQIASYITTLNLDGTLNLSGTRPFTTGVQNLNVATGGSVTYDNHLYYCFTNIVAVDSNFTITCRNQNLDNFDFKNKTLLNATYPSQSNVSSGYVYGLEDQFTGSYQLPPESVVLEGTPYGSHVGTLTLDISSSVQDTIDDIEDEVNILVDSYPPLVTLESITNIANTSATINLSVSNTALITKTGAEVDTDWNFSNPYEYEVNNWATSVNVTGLNPSVQYYVRGYVIYDGNKVYSKNATTLQTLLLPPQLQLCEYLQTDGNAYIQTDVVGSDINTCECKCYSTSNNAFIFYCHYDNTTNAFDLLINNTSPYKYTTRIFRSNTDVSNVVKGNLLTFKFNRYHNRVQFNDQVINYTHSLGSNTGRVVLFTTSGNNSGTQMYYWTSNVAKFYSCYVKTGETYEDNKGNTCSAGTAGMCDILTGTFYTNDGGGGFTHGNDII